jgi:two-component system, cell cycle sensor histidine kinase and response regulator CckA
VNNGSQTGCSTVLVVEDNSAILALFASVIKEAGFTVLTASSMEEALKIGKQNAGSIDLLLTDVLLPTAANLQLKRGPTYRAGTTGLDLYRQFKIMRPEIRAIFMSGQTDEQLKSIGILNEGWPLLRKPLMPETLLKAIHQVFEHPLSA